jgi:hypothetical protein
MKCSKFIGVLFLLMAFGYPFTADAARRLACKSNVLVRAQVDRKLVTVAERSDRSFEVLEERTDFIEVLDSDYKTVFHLYPWAGLVVINEKNRKIKEVFRTDFSLDLEFRIDQKAAYLSCSLD